MRRLISVIVFLIVLLGCTRDLTSPDTSLDKRVNIESPGGGGGGPGEGYVWTTWRWTAPTTGSKVKTYVMQIKVDDGIWRPQFTTGRDVTTTQPFKIGSTYVVRVAGVDSLGRQGVWSVQSDLYDLTVDPNPEIPPILRPDTELTL